MLTPPWRYFPLKLAFAMELTEICDLGDEMKEEVRVRGRARGRARARVGQVDFSTDRTSKGNLVIDTERTDVEVPDYCKK